MTTYRGVIIEESLTDKNVLRQIPIVSTKVERVTDEHQTPWLSQWTLHTIEVPQSRAEAVAQLLSEALDPRHSWYADYKNDTFHFIIFFGTVFRIERKSKAQYEAARRYGLSHGTPEYQLITFPGIAMDTLTHFLREANMHTYADADAPKAPPTRLHSHDYHFEQGDLLYHDTYFGSRDFLGEEIVYDTGCPVWGANYFGFILDESANEKEVYDFLRKALVQEQNDVIPVRGPRHFARGDWEYQLSINGDITRFTGEETIAHAGKTVYRLFIHGGGIG
ncbi:MAG: DUF5680 domain-containing protein [Patescibacteria group bacterium]